MIPISPAGLVLRGVLERLRGDATLTARYKFIRPYTAQQMLRDSAIEAPALAVIQTSYAEELVASNHTAATQVGVLIGIIRAFEDKTEADDVIFEFIDEMDYIRGILAREGGALMVNGVRVTDALLRFEQADEPVLLNGASVLVWDLKCTFEGRVNMLTRQLK